MHPQYYSHMKVIFSDIRSSDKYRILLRLPEGVDNPIAHQS